MRAGKVTAIGLLAAALAACGQPVPQKFDVVEATIGGIQDALQAGRVTCREVVAAYLARIEAYDKPKGLNAITVTNGQALARAEAIDARLRAGARLGPLFCAPLLVKDNYDTHDMPTTGGSIALKESYPPDDAFMVRKLRAADAIIIAKTNMAEWAFSPKRTESSSFGVTANAYALDRVPAGSSGGTASGVAAGFGVAGMGSDTGNSIRGPSSHLALFGIRSTLGLTSRDGIIPLMADRDVGGPMTRTVADGARIFNVIAGYDPADPVTELGRGRREADYTAFLDAGGLKVARIAVLDALLDTDGADPEISALFDAAVADLRAAGATVITGFTFDHMDEHLRQTWSGYACRGFRYDMHQYLESLGEGAPIRDVMEVLGSGQYSDYIKGSLEYFADTPLDVPPAEWDKPCPFYLDHPGRRAFLEDVVAAMDAGRIDAVIYPSWTNPPALLSRAEEDYKGDNSQIVAPATGMPAVTVPMGYSHGDLPAGLQFLGRPYGEGLLFKLAYAFEQATHHRRPPEGFGPLP